MRLGQFGVRFFRGLSWLAIALVLASCHNHSSALVSYAVPGLPLEHYFESATGILPAVESYARRYDTKDGPQTDIWISGIALNEKQRGLLNSKSLSDTDVSDLRAPGIMLRIHDDGSKGDSAFIVCAPNATTTIECTPSDIGTIVISRLGPERVQGAFFADSKDHVRRYALLLDASLVNGSATAIAAVDSWSDDGGDAGVVFSKMMAAAATKDVESLRSLSMPEREHDWDHFGIITSIQRTALQQPKVVAASRQGAVMHLWVLSTIPDAAARLPFRVDMENHAGTWRFARIIY